MSAHIIGFIDQEISKLQAARGVLVGPPPQAAITITNGALPGAFEKTKHAPQITSAQLLKVISRDDKNSLHKSLNAGFDGFVAPKPGRPTLTAAGRARMSEAQTARWAKIRAEKRKNVRTAKKTAIAN